MHQDKSRTYQLTILLSLSYKLVFDSNKVLLGVHQNWLIHHQYSKHKLNIFKKRGLLRIKSCNMFILGAIRQAK